MARGWNGTRGWSCAIDTARTAPTNVVVMRMISGSAIRNRSQYDFTAPVASQAKALNDPLFAELIATRAFRRLQSIRFLGGIDYLLVRSPNGVKGNIRHTRYQHSLGVAGLALMYTDLRALPFSDRRHVCAAALLHDIGHPPLSHSLEPVFKEVFGIEHHQAMKDLISGRVPLGREVYETLRRHYVDIERIIAIVTGGADDHDGFFSGPINFDTIEGILRSLTYANPNISMPKPAAVVEAALWRRDERDCATVDEFWQCKDFVYRHIINAPNGILADYACQSFLRAHLDSIRVCDYYGTEAQIFRKLPGLTRLLRSPSFTADMVRRLNESVSYTARRFFVVPDADFFQQNDKERYQQTKRVQSFSPQDFDSARYRKDLKWDLFHDAGNRTSEEAF